MDDEAYVQELFAILTNPSPTGIDPADPYGQADDRIDRYNGFGRDVRVTSATVVPGEHGAQVEIGFVLDVPDGPEWQGLGREGMVTVPLDAEWRRLSGYADPADYAPAAARSVESAARRLVERHQSGVPARSSADLPDRDAQWQVLLDGLGAEGAVRELAPGRLELLLDWGEEEPSVVSVLVTSEQWEQVLLRHRVEHVPDDYFTDLIGPLDPDSQPFIVFWEDDLVASSREELPPVHPYQPVRFIPGAAWFAYTPHATDGEPDSR